jgi:hypothetical protein
MVQATATAVSQHNITWPNDTIVGTLQKSYSEYCCVAILLSVSVPLTRAYTKAKIAIS